MLVPKTIGLASEIIAVADGELSELVYPLSITRSA